MKRWLSICVCGGCLFGLAAAAQGGRAAMHITSSAFEEGGKVPQANTCDGRDVSPALSWSGAPPGAKSFALICDDPDAPSGTWVHWVIFNLPAGTSELPAGTSELPAGVPADRELPNGARQGTNDSRKIGYQGPCPPPGNPHRYYFKLYALDAMLGLKAGATKAQLEQAMQGHVVAEAQLMGTYGR